MAPYTRTISIPPPQPARGPGRPSRSGPFLREGQQEASKSEATRNATNEDTHKASDLADPATGSDSRPYDINPDAYVDSSKNEDGWEILLKEMDGYDEKMLGDWKEELANLLTFTGLFSAVVTGFIVITIPSLQEDRATNLLAQISLQIASFSNGPKFTNSTFQPPSSDSSFHANPRDVQVNTLWATSLSLTLLSAFMAITTQQWIRRIPRPRQMSVRDAVRLRQFRHDGLTDWHVPTIISLLPIVVQLSVIIFLVGLLLFMQGINTAVFVTLTVITSSVIAPFIISSLCPLIWSQCPYKSPLIPTLWTVIRCGAVPVLLAAIGLLCSVVALTYALIAGVWSILISTASLGPRLSHSLAHFHAISLHIVSTVDGWLHHHLRSLFSRSHPYDADYFWTARESFFIRKRKADIDTSAFCWAAIGVPAQSVTKVVNCLYDLPEPNRIQAGLRWAALAIGRSFFDFNQWFSIRNPIYSGVEPDLQCANEIYEVLYKSFIPRDGANSGLFSWVCDDTQTSPQSYANSKLIYGSGKNNGNAYGGSALTLLYRHTKGSQRGSKDVKLLKDILLGVRLRQSVRGMPNTHWRWPTVFLYLYAFEGEWVYTVADTKQLLSWAHEVCEGALSFALLSRYITTSTMCAFDCALASTATALYAFASGDIPTDSPLQLRAQFVDLLSVFTQDTDNMKTYLYYTLGSLRFYGQRDGLDVPTFVADQAVFHIAEYLVKIFDKPGFREETSVAIAAVAMAGVFVDACEGYEEYGSAIEEFNRFIVSVPSVTPRKSSEV